MKPRLALKREALTELSNADLAVVQGAGPALPTTPVKECVRGLSDAACTAGCPSDGTTSCAC